MESIMSEISPDFLDLSLLEAAEIDTATYFNVQQQQVLESAWSIATVQVSQFSRVAALHANVVLTLNQQSLAALLQAFSVLIDDTAIIARDSVNFNRFFIGSIQSFNEKNSSIISIDGCDTPVLVPVEAKSAMNLNPSSSVQDQSKKKPDARNPSATQTKIPRPPNAYILYRKERHHEVKKSYPGIDNNEISCILGKKWREEPENVRMHYKKLAEDYKTQFMKAFPDYQYRPRKAAEKKHRLRQNSAILSNLASMPSSEVEPHLITVRSCDSPGSSSSSEGSTGTP
uniref:Mating-type protein MAT1-2-1 n=1 Tax=Thielaviopsis punctulata TaxID=72032 RepID=A0A2R4ZQV1_9PEZI|nr:TPA_exp: mating-type protein MAT1-2-1 [Thielaviopsis punctulata]